MFNPASGHSLFFYFLFSAAFDLLYGRKVLSVFYLLPSLPTSADTKADMASDLASNARFQVYEKEL